MAKSLLEGAADGTAGEGDGGAGVGGGAGGAGVGAEGAGEGADAEAAAAAAAAAADGGGDGAGGDGDGEGDDRLTAEEWEAKAREGVPELPEGYPLPDIEGLDKDAWEKSPIFNTLRTAAHKMGVKPDAFAELVTDYLEATETETEAVRTAEMSQLGPDQAAIDKRTSTLAGFLTRTLPKEEADAVMGMATTAAGVRGLEKLMSRAPAAAGGASPPPALDDWPTIESLMRSDAYMGREDQRDPAVVARVDAYFQKGGKRGGPK